MLVIVKSSPGTTDGTRGIKLARDMAADVVLIQNAVYFAQNERLEGFCGTVYVLGDDVRLRGLKNNEIEKGIKMMDYGSLIDLMANEDKVVGIF
jgi:sulfur relay protein TusB/DsrH